MTMCERDTKEPNMNSLHQRSSLLTGGPEVMEVKIERRGESGSVFGHKRVPILGAEFIYSKRTSTRHHQNQNRRKDRYVEVTLSFTVFAFAVAT
jgi:hypothetical protein